MPLPLESLTPPLLWDRVGICLEGAPNARKPQPPSPFFFEGRGGLLAKAHVFFLGGVHLKQNHVKTPHMEQKQNAPNSYRFPTLSMEVHLKSALQVSLTSLQFVLMILLNSF